MQRVAGFALAVIASSAFSQGLSGVPSAISGVQSEEGVAISETTSAAKTAGSYVRSKIAPVQRQDIAPPVPGAVSAIGSPVPVSSNPSAVTGDAPFGASQGTADSDTFSPVAIQRPVEIVIPEQYREVKTDRNGYAEIDGDRPGSYVVRVPPLLYSSIETQFEASLETPFPGTVVIKQHGNVSLVSPASKVPVSLVVFHPKKPSLSLSVVLLPDAEAIPARLTLKFSEDRLPVLAEEKERSGVYLDGTKTAIVVESDPDAVAAYETSDSHTEYVKRVNIDVVNGYLPDGYALHEMRDGPTGVMCGDRRLVGQYAQKLVGDEFEVDVFEVRNAADDYVTFEPKNCYRHGVVSIQFNPSRSLRPGQDAELIVVRGRGQPVDDVRVRRPSNVGVLDD